MSPGAAQVLARPGWAGSGVAVEPWWTRAVFYRVDPARFQDSGASGVGDLAGVAMRLDYLQSLGVDAIILEGGGEAMYAGTSELEELIRAASQHHLRVIVSVSPAMQQEQTEKLTAAVHDWLSQGAAGIWVAKPQPETAATDAAYANLLGELTPVLRSLPGQRILLAEPTPVPAEEPSPYSRSGRPQARAQVPELVVAASIPAQSTDPAALRQALQPIPESPAGHGGPLLRFARDPETGSSYAGADAALLLASRGAAMFDFGDEIGLDAYPIREQAADAAFPVMQWTPINVQQAPIERPKPVVTPPGGITPFGAYHAYVRPTHAPIVRKPDPNAPEPLPDPNTLPGFTKGRLPVEPIEGSKINVATEERDRNSLLNAYRQLIALHHGNATLRNGAQVVLNRDAQDALVWLRRAPAGSRTVADVVVAANLGNRPVTLSLDEDLKRLGIREGLLRPLFAWSPDPLTGESTGALMLPGHAVFIGEIFHPRF